MDEGLGSAYQYSISSERSRQMACTAACAGGLDDYFYSPELFRETAAGIPGARLCLYENMGHPARGRQFQKDVLDFLT
jgi:hypothetical protein